MSSSQSSQETEQWADWLLRARFSGSPERERELRADLRRDADRLLDLAHLRPGMTMLDVGSGDGLLALRAIERIGPSLKVIATDVSVSLLRHTSERATERGVASQCVFLQCPAESLRLIEDASVDVVVARAVVGYLPDKPAVFREFLRVLKPGGRISLADPIRRDEAFETCSLKTLITTGSAAEVSPFFTLLHRWKATQFPDTEEAARQSPMTNFSERDLVSFAMKAGYTDVHMEFHIDVGAAKVNDWDVFLDSTPFPWAPTLRQLLSDAFTAQERVFFEHALRPQVIAGTIASANRMAYLSAMKPAMANDR
ncbi:class I SAM-dependent methyltransferase [Paraburkholderia guartelaensis]|uniref:class I SAM-dependent methyltransferase n=1 Tax=Paraburkholderia guartelaensis TaxID=2546446 RepID=UPI002AB7BD5A|nr:methyltransferase domain-containing protein [Paraburkholderia guartelaensis]